MKFLNHISPAFGRTIGFLIPKPETHSSRLGCVRRNSPLRLLYGRQAADSINRMPGPAIIIGKK